MKAVQGFVAPDQKKEPDQRFLEQYASLCWQGRLHYQTEKNKLLYWVGTVFVALLAATGVVNVGTGQPFIQLTFAHSIMFHFVFAVVYFYYLYKQFRIMQYDQHRRLAEQELRKQRGQFAHMHFQELVDHRAQCAAASVRWLVKLPNILIVMMYLGVSIVPVTRIGLSGSMLQVAWQGAVSLALAIVILVTGQVLYRNARHQLRMHHSRDLELDQDGNVECSWPRIA